MKELATERTLNSLSVPFVYRDGPILVLHFEIDAAQSMMDEGQPDRLLLNYTRLMMAVLLFIPNPRHIGCIGLGGGSIPKYCYRHLPQSRVTVAEINPAVISLRQTFQIPDDDGRFEVLELDGAEFVAGHAEAFDLLMVDAFDLYGQPRHLCTSDFYAACYAALTHNGFLAVNLCHAGTEQAISRIERIFNKPVYRLRDAGSRNLIILVGKGQTDPEPGSKLLARASDLERTHALPFQQIASTLLTNFEIRAHIVPDFGLA